MKPISSSTYSAIAIEERMDGLELVMHERSAQDGGHRRRLVDESSQSAKRSPILS
jgi:hypothetical protein